MVWAARGLEPWGQQKGSLKAGQQQGSQEEGQHLGLYRRWRALGSAPGFRAVINSETQPNRYNKHFLLFTGVVELICFHIHKVKLLKISNYFSRLNI